MGPATPSSPSLGQVLPFCSPQSHSKLRHEDTSQGTKQHCLKPLPGDYCEPNPEFPARCRGVRSSPAAHRVGFAFAAQDFGDAEVSDLDDHAMLVQEDVLGLQVTVQDLLGVHVVQGQENLHKEVQDGVLIQQRIAALVDELCQSAPCKEQQRAVGMGGCTGQLKPGLQLGRFLPFWHLNKPSMWEKHILVGYAAHPPMLLTNGSTAGGRKEQPGRSYC